MSEQKLPEKVFDEVQKADFVVVGSGIAGLFCALNLAEQGQVALLTKGAIDESNSYFAQGGLAAAIRPPDSPESHLRDTLSAGAGLCDVPAVRILVNEGPGRARELMSLGVEFDSNAEGIALTREAAHSYERILHAQGDATGKAISQRLMELVLGSAAIRTFEQHRVCGLWVKDGVCRGALVHTEGKRKLFVANAVILATGGAGQLFLETSNPPTATGEGVALAFQAGAVVKDIEFFQFHPTVLMAGEVGRPRFLVSETVRGEGAVLRNSAGERFMPRYHELADLAPRDVVSRAIWEEMRRAGERCVYLDATGMSREHLCKRFPTIFRVCLESGIDMSKDLVPVAPAAHYMMGGVKTDLEACTSIPGLYACGEVACTGVHGANRLASNSLLETLVFGKRAAQAAVRFAEENPAPTVSSQDQACEPNGLFGCIPQSRAGTDQQRLEDLRMLLRTAMWDCVGIVRDRESLQNARSQLAGIRREIRKLSPTIDRWELESSLQVACLVVEGALVRQESRGGHYRRDYPNTSEAWRKHIAMSRVKGVYFEDVED